MNQETEQPVFRQTVAEGDIDWLLCVELNASAAFRDWMAAQLFPGLEGFAHVGAWRSISNHLGESDLLWLVSHPDAGRQLALIENKINAPAQPDQYERYVQRSQIYLDEGVAETCVIALVAPEKYRSKEYGLYPVTVTYEAIRDWLVAQNDPRAAYLAAVFDGGISKRLNVAPVDEAMMAFRQAFWDLAAAEFPELTVTDPSIGGGDYWLYVLEDNYRIVVKTYTKGFRYTGTVVDLELTGRADDVEALRETHQAALEACGFEVVKTGKSASIRTHVSMLSPPEVDVGRLREALRAAQHLNTWWQSISES